MGTDLHTACLIPIEKGSDFTIYNLPLGIFSYKGKEPRVGMAIGNFIIDVHQLNKASLFGKKYNKSIFKSPYLNEYIALGKEQHLLVRQRIQELLTGAFPKIFKKRNQWLIEQSIATMHFPVQTGDYTDFYSGEHHAANVGKLFRKNEAPLLPNWKHLPVAYHGRSSSLIVSGKSIHRPKGQILNKDNQPIYSPSKCMDFELELAFIIGKNSQQGHPISTAEADDYIFGYVLLNDWSARDIQRWEYVPLGPFLGKNFATSISHWVVTSQALQPFLCEHPQQIPEVLPYLQQEGKQFLDIALQVDIKTQKGHQKTVTKTNATELYWSPAQQLAHHTVNGCNVRIGDIMASGTISGALEGTWGSLLETTYNGTKAIEIGKETRTFLEDGDTVILRGHAGEDAFRVGFGTVENQLLPVIEK
ncbi:MAG: fumarylacetoacetase [Chitinophagales bacterium]|nr:fumarylacetoacetase [Chitinophagales bacterium]